MPYGIAYLSLVEIGRGCVDHPVAGFECVCYDPFRLVLGNLENPESYGRHYHSIVQSYFFHRHIVFDLQAQSYKNHTDTLLQYTVRDFHFSWFLSIFVSGKYEENGTGDLG